MRRRLSSLPEGIDNGIPFEINKYLLEKCKKK
jgi:hypothetical protein